MMMMMMMMMTMMTVFPTAEDEGEYETRNNDRREEPYDTMTPVYMEMTEVPQPVSSGPYESLQQHRQTERKRDGGGTERKSDYMVIIQ